MYSRPAILDNFYLCYMNIRLANPNDLIALAAIRATDSASREHWLERMIGYFNGNYAPQFALTPRVVFVAVDENITVGFIAGHLTTRYDCEGELQWLNTIEEYRGKGIATLLFRRLAGWFVEQRALRICVNCAPENQAALNFYRQNGAVSLNDHWLVWECIGQQMPV